MKIQRGDIALITGASRGIGRHIALALAGKGMNLVLAARGESGLNAVADEVRTASGVTVWTLTVDLADRAQAAELITRAEAVAGHIDVLVNNAGIETVSSPEEGSVDDLATICDVNLLAPMVLTRAALPGMIAQRRGHVINISSVAGLIALAYQEPYNATKFGLVGFTRALRQSAADRGWGVGASAVCPGFIAEDGMFADMGSEYGVTAPWVSGGTLPAERVGGAVVKAIENDLPEVIVMRGPARALIATSYLAPRLFERLVRRLDLAAPFRTVVQRRGSNR
jgi:short-subunit dehydrogenase